MLMVLTKTDLGDPVREAVLQRLPQLGAALVEPALAFHEATANDEIRFAVEWALSECGVRDDRILRILLARLVSTPRFAALQLQNYGDPAALPALSAAFDRLDLEGIGPAFGWIPDTDFIEFARAIKSLGGTLTADQEGKFAFSVDGKRRMGEFVRRGFRQKRPLLS
jgi:hypothetical protein